MSLTEHQVAESAEKPSDALCAPTVAELALMVVVYVKVRSNSIRVSTSERTALADRADTSLRCEKSVILLMSQKTPAPLARAKSFRSKLTCHGSPDA